MSTTISYPLINGVRHDFSSIRATIHGLPMSGISAIDYTVAKPVGDVFGTSSFRLGRTRGQVKFTGSITLYQTEFAALAATLSQMGTGLMSTEFHIVVQYSDGGLNLITDTIEGCLITNIGNSHSQGSNALVVKLDLDVNNIKYNKANLLPKNEMPQAVGVASL